MAQIGALLQPSNHVDWKIGVKPVTRKVGMKTGQAEPQVPKENIAYKWQGVDLRRSGQRQASLPGLPPSLLSLHSNTVNTRFRRYEVIQWKVSLPILSFCHSVSLLTEPTHYTSQHSLHMYKHLCRSFLHQGPGTTLTALPCAFFNIVSQAFASLTWVTSTPQPQWHFHTPLTWFSTFGSSSSPSSSIPCSYFISSSSSPSICLHIEVIIELETAF